MPYKDAYYIHTVHGLTTSSISAFFPGFLGDLIIFHIWGMYIKYLVKIFSFFIKLLFSNEIDLLLVLHFAGDIAICWVRRQAASIESLFFFHFLRTGLTTLKTPQVKVTGCISVCLVSELWCICWAGTTEPRWKSTESAQDTSFK